MSHILIVQSSAPEAAQAVAKTALGLFERIHKLKPSCSFLAGGTAAFSFPHLYGTQNKIECHTGSGAWLAGAGCWFYGGSNSSPALQSLMCDIGGNVTADRSIDTQLGELDGIFLLAGGDRDGEGFHVITDRLGTLHGFKATIGNCLVICTSSLILAAIGSYQWDPVSCREFLATGIIYEQRTLFTGIEKLKPATCYHFRNGREQSAHRYWDAFRFMARTAPANSSRDALAHAIQRSLNTIYRNFPKPVLDLTGGLDSRLVLGAALKAGLDIDVVVNGSEKDPDVIVSSEIAKTFGLRHLHQIPRVQSPEDLWAKVKLSLPLADGECDALQYAATFDVHTRLASQFDVSINGSNGEICKGYWWELLAPFTGTRTTFDASGVAAKRFAYEGEPDGLFSFRFDGNLASHFAGVIQRANQGLEASLNTAKMDNVYLALRMQRWQGRIASATSRIWPIASPFMFREFLEGSLSAPPSERVRCRMTRRLIEDFDPKLAAVSLTDGCPAEPLRLSNAHRFWPAARYLAHKSAVRVGLIRNGATSPQIPSAETGLWGQEEVRDILNPRAMASLEIFDPTGLSHFLTSSQQALFSQPRRFARLLTIELLARSIKANRQQV